MGIYVIRVPDIGEGIAEVELVGWNVQVGDSVAEDQHLADVMTDLAGASADTQPRWFGPCRPPCAREVPGSPDAAASR